MPLGSTFKIGTQIILSKIDGFLKGWILNITPLKFFVVVLKFELPNTRVLNFLKNSAPSLIGPVLIIGDCLYIQSKVSGRFRKILWSSQNI